MTRAFEAGELSPTDELILDVLHDGRATRGMLVDEIDRYESTIDVRLVKLEERGHITLVHERTSLWELEFDPR